MRRKGILLALGLVLSVLLASGVAAGSGAVLQVDLLGALNTLVDFLNALISALGDAGINPELSGGTSTATS